MSDTAEHDAPPRSPTPPHADEQRIDRRSPPDQSGRDRDTASGNGNDKDDKPRRKSRWPLIILGVVVVIAIVAGVIYWFATAGEATTSDAYTQGNSISIAPKISGYVTALNVNDNSYVKAGQLLLTIDDRQYVAAVDQARANLQLAQNQLASAQVALEEARIRAPATLQQAQAQLAQAQANHMQAEREYRRQHAVNPRATTQASIDQANAALRSATANVTAADAQVKIASLVKQAIQASKDTVAERQAQVAQAQANLEQAKVNLSFTQIRAPQDGWITQRNVDKGSFVQAGQQVFYIVTPQVWVVANFKETELSRIHPGQKVAISVDAFPKLHLKGHVDSIQAGSGAQFSAFPAENATGNFVKIVRRVPVKIDIDSGLPKHQRLPLGISVEPTVTVK